MNAQSEGYSMAMAKRRGRGTEEGLTINTAWFHGKGKWEREFRSVIHLKLFVRGVCVSRGLEASFPSVGWNLEIFTLVLLVMFIRDKQDLVCL